MTTVGIGYDHKLLQQTTKDLRTFLQVFSEIIINSHWSGFLLSIRSVSQFPVQMLVQRIYGFFHLSQIVVKRQKSRKTDMNDYAIDKWYYELVKMEE